ncbi:MAG: prephenate dehydratase [Hassallia sp.]
MTQLIAHLGPPGTYAEQAALFYLNWLAQNKGIEANLCPYPSIAQSLQAVVQGNAQLAVVPVENSIEGSVTMTLDSLWQLETLRIQMALVMPIAHALISAASSLNNIKIVSSHPQALAQCQRWLEKFLPNVQLIPTNSTTEPLQRLEHDKKAAVISSSRAAQLYNLPILARGINDYPENCTRFLVVSQTEVDTLYRIPSASASHTSLAFSMPANTPGCLVKPLQIFAELNINLSKIESRPTKRSLGEYLFFIDLEVDSTEPKMQSALAELSTHAEVLKIFGSYNVLPANAL